MGEGAVFTILLPFRETGDNEKVEMEERIRGGLAR